MDLGCCQLVEVRDPASSEWFTCAENLPVPFHSIACVEPEACEVVLQSNDDPHWHDCVVKCKLTR